MTEPKKASVGIDWELEAECPQGTPPNVLQGVQFANNFGMQVGLGKGVVCARAESLAFNAHNLAELVWLASLLGDKDPNEVMREAADQIVRWSAQS